MAYLVKNLGIQKKGQTLFVIANKKHFTLKLVNKIDIDNMFFINRVKEETFSMVVNNYKTNFKIPTDGFWEVHVNEKKSSKKFVFDLKVEINN